MPDAGGRNERAEGAPSTDDETPAERSVTSADEPDVSALDVARSRGDVLAGDAGPHHEG
ncbi:MAG: hypothetical protein AAGN82_20140 [Myxococcota bacterium]